MPALKQTATLLIITPENSEAERIVAALRDDGLAVKHVTIPHADRLEDAVTQRDCDIVICCAYDRNVDLDAVLSAHRTLGRDAPLILISDPDASATDMVKARRSGVRDLILRNDQEQLKLVVRREWNDLQGRREARGLIERIQLAERRSRELIDVTGAGVAFIQDGLHIDANPAYLTLFGYHTLDDLQTTPFLDLVEQDHHKQIREVLRSRNATLHAPMELAITCRRVDETQFPARLLAARAEMDDEFCLRLVVMANDAPVSTKRMIVVAGAGNSSGRAALLAEIESHIGDDRVVERPFAIFYIRLRGVPDLLRDLGLTNGLGVVDEFMQSLASIVGERGYLARINDEGYGLVVAGLSEFDAKALAEDIMSMARLPRTGTSTDDSGPDCDVGYFLVNDRAAAAEDILNAAYRLCIGHAFADRDQAMGQALPTSLAARARQEVEDGDVVVARKIEYALKNDQLKLVYQPIISLMGDSQENYSVLLRLLDEEENLLEAKDFIGPAIRGGLIEDIDKWAIRASIQVISEQRRAGHSLSLFLNLSEDTFRNPSIILWICDCLREFDVRGNWLTFQFQEELVAGNLASIGKLVETLKKIKCKVAVNRFGITERPEILLQGLSLDYVILKPSFAQGLAEDQSKQKRLLDLASLAREFNVKSIVTGVEDARALTVLWTAGVDYVQGNFLQRPSPTLEVQA
jgi:multidomain signaling protein FimX